MAEPGEVPGGKVARAGLRYKLRNAGMCKTDVSEFLCSIDLRNGLRARRFDPRCLGGAAGIGRPVPHRGNQNRVTRDLDITVPPISQRDIADALVTLIR
jgi:hypothetical protein